MAKTKPAQVRELIELAVTYWDDGALRTAADRLDKAAALLRSIADDIDALVAFPEPAE